MKKLFHSLGATALALSFAITPVMSASAEMMRVPIPGSNVQSEPTFQLAKSKHERRQARRHHRREVRRDRRHHRREVRPERRHERREARHERRAERRFVRRNGWAYYNGHRGYRHYHHGYRYYNGWWFPATAFIGAAIIGNAIANSNSGGSAHVQWCYDHYRSYRAYDNTYQPYHGPRRQCYSPYS